MTLTPIHIAAWLFGIAALGGIAMAAMRFSGKPHPPAAFAMGHGLLAAAGLTLLVYAAFTTGVPQLAKVSLALFLGAAAGGAYMNLNFHRKGQALPKAIVIGHGLTAAAAYVCLLLAIRGG